MKRAILFPSDPDHRYLRRQGNLRVRKARFARNAVRWTGGALLHLTLAGVLAYTVWSAAGRIAAGAWFELRRVELQGASPAPAAAIRAETSDLVGRNVFALDLADVERRLLRNARVRSASVKLVLPDTLRLRVVEREPAALALIGGRPHVVDTTGYVIGPWAPEAGTRYPVLTGLDRFDDAELAAALRRGVELLRRLRAAEPSFARSIAEADLSRGDRVTVREIVEAGPLAGDPAAEGEVAETGPRGGDPAAEGEIAAVPSILLDPAEVERNVAEYLALRDQIERRLGRVQTVDLRWRDRIAVRPADQAEPGENG